MNYLATIRRVLKGKRWRLPPPLQPWQVEEFERQQGVELPYAYRNYLLTVAGAPPASSHGYELRDCLENHAKYGDFLRTPFPHLEAWNDPDRKDYGDPKHVVGSLLLTHEGCCIYFRLVITGPMRDTVWEDSRGADAGIFPLEDKNHRPMTFAEWLAQAG